MVALSGGVGGARLLHGLSRVLEPDALTAIVNTGDDFEHWGLSISPDLDTVMYTLADLAHEERGWGLAEESFNALAMMKRYGGEDWFALGDRDLATHLVRTEALRRGETLGAVTRRMTEALGVRCRVLPMADAPCRTIIETTTHGSPSCSSNGSSATARSLPFAVSSSTPARLPRPASSKPSRAPSSS